MVEVDNIVKQKQSMMQENEKKKKKYIIYDYKSCISIPKRKQKKGTHNSLYITNTFKLIGPRQVAKKMTQKERIISSIQ